jgi:hypothetical protein
MSGGGADELTVTLRRQGEHRDIPLLALAAAIHIPIEQMRHACAYLLDAVRDPPRDGYLLATGEGVGGEGTLNGSQTFPPEISKERNVERGAAALEAGHCEPLLERVVRALDDEKSRAYLSKLIVSHPSELVEEALRETLAASDKISTRRGAYFVGTLRRMAFKTLHS